MAYRFGTFKAARLAESLARAIDEHGAPNSFSPSELATRHSVQIPRARLDRWGDRTYRWSRAVDYGRDWDRIVFILRESGYSLVYSDRRFEVHSAPEETK